MALGRDDAGRLARRLFPGETGAEEAARFLQALQGNQNERALLWMGESPSKLPAELGERLPPAPWQPEWIDRVTRVPGFGHHPWHLDGRCYAFDLSSTFTASLMLALPDRPRTIIDLCAAPGGKSLFANRAFHPGRLISNEVIGKRQPLLRGNLNRCGVAAEVTRLDPEVMAGQQPGSAALVIVDAPCSGQSLPAKGIDNPGCFHPVNIKKNAGRQRRILAAAAKLVMPGGALFYSTCTFAPEENEKAVEWLMRTHPGWEAWPSPRHQEQASTLVEWPCYRLHPQDGWGAGGFAALLRKAAG